jgi:hypothetical protein
VPNRPSRGRLSAAWEASAAVAEGLRPSAPALYSVPRTVYSPRMTVLPDITLSPFLAFVFALVIPGALTILLAALLWTRRT